MGWLHQVARYGVGSPSPDERLIANDDSAPDTDGEGCNDDALAQRAGGGRIESQPKRFLCCAGDVLGCFISRPAAEALLRQGRIVRSHEYRH
jgi:hypothetical protein